MKRWTIALVAAQVLACAEPDVQQDFQALERLAEDFACECGDAPDCDALEGELWTEPGMESECVRAALGCRESCVACWEVMLVSYKNTKKSVMLKL